MVKICCVLVMNSDCERGCGNGNGMRELENFHFQTPLQTILISKKPNSVDAINFLHVLVPYLHQKHLTVAFEPEAWCEVKSIFTSKIIKWDKEAKIDLVIALGGDGTLLHVASLFPCIAPPILPFNFGSLGFLSPFSPDEFKIIMEEILSLHSIRVCRRNRLTCQVHHTTGSLNSQNENIPQHSIADLTALNEITINRGMVHSMCTFELYINGLFVTTMDSDGIIIATSTGSTAYSLSAGGTIVYPSIPVVLLTPICPHSLTSRPLILPEDVHICIRIPESSRGGAFVCVDGKTNIPLQKGDYVKISVSPYAISCLTRDGVLKDWVVSLSQCLSWSTDRKNRNHQTKYLKFDSKL
jgi:NAD+ kinase